MESLLVINNICNKAIIVFQSSNMEAHEHMSSNVLETLVENYINYVTVFVSRFDFL